jgi:hypothetical protein
MTRARQFNDPVDIAQRTEHRRSMAERTRRIEEAVKQAKRKNPDPLLDLIADIAGDDELRQAMEDDGILQPQRKRGPKVKIKPPLQLAINRVRREIARRKRLLGGRRLPPGTWDAVIKQIVLPMMWMGDFDYLKAPVMPTRKEIYKDVCLTVYAAVEKGKPRRKTTFS